MSECKNKTCDNETAECYQWDYCSSSCEIMTLRKENNELTKKVERLEKAIWEFQYSEYSHSPEEIQEYLDEIYTGKLDERFDKVIAECKKDWEPAMKGENCE